MEWRERGREVTQINVSTQTTITSSSGSGSSLPRPPSPPCLSSASPSERERESQERHLLNSAVSGKSLHTLVRNTSHRTQVVEAMATVGGGGGLRWHCDSASPVHQPLCAASAVAAAAAENKTNTGYRTAKELPPPFMCFRVWTEGDYFSPTNRPPACLEAGENWWMSEGCRARGGGKKDP